MANYCKKLGKKPLKLKLNSSTTCTCIVPHEKPKAASWYFEESSEYALLYSHMIYKILKVLVLYNATVQFITKR